MPPPEVVTFAPNAVTISGICLHSSLAYFFREINCLFTFKFLFFFSAINNEGVTRLLEVVKISKNNKQTAENVNNNQDDALSAPIIPSKGRRTALKNAQIFSIFNNIFPFFLIQTQ